MAIQDQPGDAPERSGSDGVSEEGGHLWGDDVVLHQGLYKGGIDEMAHQRSMTTSGETLPITALGNPFDLTSAARVLQSEIIAGRILLPPSDPWVSTFMEEMCQWPTVRTDSRVKAMCVLMSALPNMTPPARGEMEPSGKGSPWAA